MIYIEDNESLPAISLTPLGGFTISPDPTVDLDKYARKLILNGEIKVEGIRDKIKSEYDSVTWAAGSQDQRVVWSKWGVANVAERDSILSQADQETLLKEVFLLSLEGDNLHSAQDKATEMATQEPQAIEDQVKTGFVKLADFASGAIYTTTSSGFASIPIQVMVPKAIDIHPGLTVKGTIIVDYFLDTGVEGEVELQNYTDLVSVAGSQFTITTQGVWSYAISPKFDLTEGKSYRIRSKRKTGTGNNKVYIEAATLILSYE